MPTDPGATNKYSHFILLLPINTKSSFETSYPNSSLISSTTACSLVRPGRSRSPAHNS